MFEEELAAVPVNPPRIGVLPGMRISAALPRSTLLLLIVLVFFFGMFPLIELETLDPHAKLGWGPSQTAQGRVLSIRRGGSCQGANARQIVYSFTAVSGQEFRGSGVVCEQSAYYDAQGGDRIEIRYLTREPTVNAIVGNEVEGPPAFFFLFFPLVMLFFLAPMFLPQINNVLRARRLYRSGVLAQGRVVFVKRRSTFALPGWPGASAADVYVAHLSPAGAPLETVVWCANDWVINHLAPGTGVHILLPPGKSARGVLLEAFIR
jgi:hypothetical protein